LRGNHSATVLIAAGKLPASPRPSAKRAAAKPATLPTSVAHGGEAPHCNCERVPDPRAEPIDDRTGRDQPDRVSGLERSDDVAVVDLAPMQLALQLRGEDSQHLTIDVVDGRCRQQQRADAPAVPPRRDHSPAWPIVSTAVLRSTEFGPAMMWNSPGSTTYCIASFQ